MTSGQLAGLLATVGAAFLAQAVACALLYRRVRRLGEPRPSGDPTATADLAPVLALVRSLAARLDRVEAGATTDRPDPAPDSPAKRGRRLDRRQVASVDGPVLIAVPSLALPPANSTTAEAAELGRRFGGIWALADAGHADDEIARQTGLPVGQVELILGLRGAGGGADRSRMDPARDETDV